MTAHVDIAVRAQSGGPARPASPAWGAWGAAGIAAAAAAVQLSGPINHDVAWILIGAQWVLDGAEIGREVVDVNPPLPWWLSAAAIQAGRGIGLGPATAFVLFTAAAALVGLALTRAALARTESRLPASPGFLLFAAAALLLAPGYDFGQREHLLLIALLPWLAAAAAALAGKPPPPRLGVAIGLFAAAGICLKPHFLLIPLAAEAWLLWRTRRMRLRPELLALAAACMLYAAAVLLWAPAWLAEVLPGALGGYGAYASTVEYVFLQVATALLPFACSAFLLVRRRGASEPLAEMLFVGAGAAATVALLQMKGWPYHLLAASGLAALGCAALWFGARRNLRGDFVALAALLLVLLASLGAGAGDAWRRATGAERPAVALAETVRRHAGPDAGVFAFLTSPRDVHPAMLDAGAAWAAPSCCLHLLPAAVRPDASAADRAVANAQLGSVLVGLERRRPELILVDDRPGKLALGGRFDYVAYLAPQPRWQRLLGGYRELPPVAGFRVFVRRVPDR